MKRKDSSQQDEARLEKKVAERRKGVDNAEGDGALRSLKKRLKRAQRRRRTLATRLRHAAGKTAGSPDKPQAAAQT